MDDYDSLIGETQQVDENALLTESGGIVGALLILFMVMKGSAGAGLIASPIAGLVEYFFHELPAKRLKAKMLKLFKDPTKRQEVLNMAKEVESYLSPGQQRYLKGLVNSIDKKQLEDEISQAYIDIDSYVANKDRMIKRGEWEDYLKREKELADIRRTAAQKAKDKKAKQIKENIESEITSYIKDNPIPDNIDEETLSEAYVPSNIKDFAKRKGISRLVNTVAGWAEKVGARITGGTAIGYNYNTLILDMGYQTSDIRIDCEEETVELYDEPVNSFAEFKRVFMEEESRKQAEHDEETLRRERGLEEIKQRVFNKLKK